MRRTLSVCSAIALLLVTSAATFSADGDAPRAVRPIWGTVVKASADSITIQPEAPRARRRRANQNAAPPASAPAERTFALSNDQTDYAFAEVGARMMMADGSTIRTLHDPVPATAADVKPGQLVEVTPGTGAEDAAATMVIIVWSSRGTIVKVDADSITFRPDPAANDRDANAADGKADKAGAAGANDEDNVQTLKLGKDTAVRIKALTDERPGQGGRGFTQTFAYKSATRADLKAEQSIDVCIKDGTAMKITINQAEPAKP